MTIAAFAAPEVAGALGEAGGAAAGAGIGEGSALTGRSLAGGSATARAARRPAPRKPMASRAQTSAPTTRRHAGSRAKTHLAETGKRAVKPPSLDFLGKGDGASRVLVAEYIACVFLIGTTPVLMRSPDKDGHLYVPNDFVRLTAVSIVFFVLALLANGKRTAKGASAFGALVTLGVLFNASGSITAIGNIFTNASQRSGAVTTAAAGTSVVEVPTFSPVTLGYGNASSFTTAASAIQKAAQTASTISTTDTGALAGAAAGVNPGGG